MFPRKKPGPSLDTHMRLKLLSESDLRNISAFLQTLYSPENARHLPEVILDGIAQLIPCEHASYNEFNSKTNESSIIMRPWVEMILDLTRALEANLDQHPVLQYYRQPHSKDFVRKVSDFISNQDFREMGLYREVYSRLDTKYQFGCLLSNHGASSDIAIGINRKIKDFNERDRAVLEFLRPHLIQARQNAMAFLDVDHRAKTVTEALDSASVGLILLNERHQLVWLTPRAEKLLQRYFPNARSGSKQLPEQMVQWMDRFHSSLESGSALDTPPILTVRKPNSILRMRYQGDDTHSGRLLLTEDSLLTPGHYASRFGVTAREAEVLHWIVEGKNNPEIGLILGISGRTVDKHVERVLSKMGVENRASAIRQALVQGR